MIGVCLLWSVGLHARPLMVCSEVDLLFWLIFEEGRDWFLDWGEGGSIRACACSENPWARIAAPSSILDWLAFGIMSTPGFSRQALLSY